MKIKKTKASANSWYQYLPILRLEKIAFGTVLQIKKNNFMLYHNFFLGNTNTLSIIIYKIKFYDSGYFFKLFE